MARRPLLSTPTSGFTTPLQRKGGGRPTPPTPPPPPPAPEPPAGPPEEVKASLWESRWPSIALQECRDAVTAAPPQARADVRRDLPCGECPEASRCLNAKRKEIGSLMFDREIQTSPRSSESTLFPRSLMRGMFVQQPCVPFFVKPLGLQESLKIIQAWDIAWSEKTGADYLVCMTALYNMESHRRRLLDVQRWRGRTYPQQIELITERQRTFGADLVVIESDAQQIVWSQSASRASVPVLPHRAGDDKPSLQRGVPSLLVAFENRQWEIPWIEGSLHHAEIENWLVELEAFSWVDGKLQGVGEHDDTVMCFWHLNWGVERWINGLATESHRGTQEAAH